MSNLKLIRGGQVLPGAHEPLIADGGVLVDGATIRAVDRFQGLRAAYPQAEVLGTERMAVIPGLVNAHHHSHATSTFQHGVPDDLLEPWILSLSPMRRASTYLNTLLSCARQLRSGVTTVVDVHSAVGDARSYAESVDQGLAAYDRAGMRVAFTTGQTMQSFLVHGEDEDRRFLESLPPDLRARAQTHVTAARRMAPDEYLAVVEERVRRHAGHPRIDVWFGPPGPQWISERLLLDIAQRAEDLDTGIQTHCVESHYEMLHGLRSYGRPTVEHLHELGVLTERFSLAHGVWLTQKEIGILAETGATVSHNPSSNLRLRAGIAPLNAMLAAGVTLGLGMDGTTLNEDEDMFTEMRLALRLHRSPRISEPVPTLESIFAMATTGGARLMRKADRIGRLAPGYRADLVLLDMTRMTWPWCAPEADPRQLIFMQARAGDVHTVLVEGETVLEAGRPTRFDLEQTALELAEDLAGQPHDDAAAALIAELVPHLAKWYEGWEDARSEPYIHYNART